MQAAPDLKKKITKVLLLAAALTMVSCATEKKTALIKDPNQKDETLLPWNKQEGWEQGNDQLSRMNERR